MKKSNKWRTAAVVLLSSAAIGYIQMPASYGTAGNADEEAVEVAVKNTLFFTGTTGTSKWQFLVNFPHGFYMVFRDLRTGTLHKVFTGDAIIVRFSDGSKVRLINKGIYAPLTAFFQWDHGSERKPDGTRYALLHNAKTRVGRGDGRAYVTSVSTPIYTASWTWGVTPTVTNW